MAIAEATPDPRSQWQRLLDRLGITRFEGAALAVWHGEHGLVVRDPRVLAVAMSGTMMVLLMLQSMLYVPTGWGVEDWLGWVDDSAAGPVAAMLALWRECEYLWLARSYLLIDSLLFVPVYVAFFIMLGSALARALADDRGDTGVRALRRWAALFLLPVLVLALVDLVENGTGLLRVGGLASTTAIGTAVVSLAGAWVLPPALHTLARWHWSPGIAALVVLGAAALAIGIGLGAGDTCASPAGSWVAWLGCGAHRAKGWLVPLVVLVPVGGALAWFFSVGLAPRSATGAPGEAALRARLRAAVFDCVVRSRYVLIALALMAGLTVVMDQTRDVIASSAAFLPRLFDGTWGDVLGRLVGTGLVFGTSAVALGAFMFSCWLWTRSACHLAAPGHSRGVAAHEVGHRYEDRFARDWARLLAIVPVLLIVLLSSQVLQDLARAGPGAGRGGVGFWRCAAPSAGVLLFALLAVAVGAMFLWGRGRHRDGDGYYDCIDWRGWVQRAGFVRASPPRPWQGASRTAPKAAKYAFFGLLSPARLPIVALVLALVCRAVDLHPWFDQEHVPTLVLPIVLLLLTFWLCVFGWLSLLEIHDAVPWVLLLIALVGVLGLFGLTDNHVVWPAALPDPPSPWGGLGMLAFSAALAVAVLLAYRFAVHVARDRADRGSIGPRVTWGRAALWCGTLLVIVGGVMALGNHVSPRRPVADTSAAPTRPTLDAALAGWLTRLCNVEGDVACRPAVPLADGGALDVFFVSAEGGGIRAAVWTAMSLQRLARDDPHFVDRTFAISAVSGGAVGASVFRACHEAGDDAARQACVASFADADLLSPLLSAWLFDDMLAGVLPSSWCDTPGCGFLSRGAWFEQTMEAAVPGLRPGIAHTRRTVPAGVHRPYLLLNATWVETGERAIASDLRITPDHFPAAKDPLWLRARDLPLATAAHNAARFPYVNAIGIVRASDRRCDRRTDAALPPDVDAEAPQGVCGHVADGGYFDNAGAQTTSDLVQALQQCLTIDRRAAPAEQTRFARCLALPPAQRAWLRAHVVPRILMVRNETQVRAADEADCGRSAQPAATQVLPAAPAACVSAYGERYRPDRPACGRGRVPYLDVVGPLLVVVNTSGIGANGRLAEARQHEVVASSRAALGSAARASCAPTVQTVNLLPTGVRFPLGWHLSRGAVENMARQADACALPPTACAPSAP